MESAQSIRIKVELKEAGVTSYGMSKFAIHYLPQVIERGEHIKGVIYGRYADENGSLKLNAGVLVATDKRVVFLDHKPGYTRTDDIDYKVVSGVKKTTAIFSAVTLFTPIKNYSLRFVNSNCANKFAKYVEERIAQNNRS